MIYSTNVVEFKEIFTTQNVFKIVLKSSNIELLRVISSLKYSILQDKIAYWWNRMKLANILEKVHINPSSMENVQKY